jgi:kanamycin kinase
MLHDLPHGDCPVQNRMDAYFSLAEKNFQSGTFDLSFASAYGIFDAKNAWNVLSEGRKDLKNDTLLHGDYCLPNVMLDGWRLSGFIDLGNGGVGDRHVDLYWGAWTLRFNLKTDRYRQRFFDAYGRDKIRPELIRTVAAAEVFG